MLNDMEFHHIGVAVFSIEKTSSTYAQLGYAKTDTVFDPIQHVNICFLTKDGEPTVELLEPADDKSPVCDTLKKNGVTPYHTCYAVDNLSKAADELKSMRYLPLGKAVAAVAFGGKSVQFFYHKNMGLIELVER